MINYHNELVKFISTLDGRRRIALHSCCAPCSSYVLEFLREYFDVTVFFYNPNIHPEAEYVHRLAEQRRLCCEMGISLVECEYDPKSYFESVVGLENEPEGGLRCEKCFELRLENTARTAERAGFELLTTTLTVSPHKNAELLNSIGRTTAEKHGLTWLPCDFKKRGGYQRSIVLSREHGLYRQNYCGCVFSLPKQEDDTLSPSVE